MPLAFAHHASRPDHHPLARILTFLILLITVLAAVYEFGTAFAILCAICTAFVLMFMARLQSLAGVRGSQPVGSFGMLRGDGGAFPGAKPEPRGTMGSRTIVMDGGSLEHHRS